MPYKIESMSLGVYVNKWYDKVNGNTYHSVRILEATGEGEAYKEEFIAENPITYGYGDHYKQTTLALLQEKGLFPKTGKRLISGCDADYYEFMQYMMNNRDKIGFIVYDVNRKCDL